MNYNFSLTIDEIYYLMKGAENHINEIQEHIKESKSHLETAIIHNDTEWQKTIIDNIEYDTKTICTLKSAIEKLKTIK